MQYLNRSAAAVLALLSLAVPAHAQQPLSLQIAAGRVSLHAQNVPVRQILAEWARVGGTTIVNGDRVVGPPVSLDLRDVPERQALDILLRGVSGHVLGARLASAPGASGIDRILILATSNAPRPAPTTFVNGPANRFPQPQPQPQQVEQAEPDENPAADVPPGQTARPTFRPGPPRRVQAPVQPPFGPELQQPSVTQPEPDDTPDASATPAAVPPNTANPFGVPAGTSATPGVITPVPQAPAQPAPRRNIQAPD
jgi:hypothetical protein